MAMATGALNSPNSKEAVLLACTMPVKRMSRSTGSILTQLQLYETLSKRTHYAKTGTLLLDLASPNRGHLLRKDVYYVTYVVSQRIYMQRLSRHVVWGLRRPRSRRS
jgi:hypothetical protein